jgi:hypothetical protein
MGIAITHNVDGTVTVTCGDDHLTFFPGDDDGGLGEIGAGAGGGDDDGGRGGSGAGSVATGAGAGGDDRASPSPPAPPGRRKRRLDGGWPLPGSMGFVAGRTFSRSNQPPLSIRFDHTTSSWQAGAAFRSRVQTLQGAGLARPGERVPVAVVTPFGQAVELARIQAALPDLEGMVGRPVFAILSGPRNRDI